MNSTFQSTSTYSTKVLYDVHKGEKKRIHEILVTQMGFKFSQKHIDYKAPVSVMIADAVLNMIEIPPKILSVVNNTTNKIYLDDEQYKLRIRKGQMNKLVCYENKTYRPFFARLTVDAKLGGYYTHSSCKGEGKRKKHYVNTKKCQLLFPSHKVWSLMKKYNIDDVIATMKMDGHLNEEGEFRNIFTLLNDEFIKKQFDKKTTKYTSNGIIVSTSQRNTSNLNGEYVHYQIQCNTPPSFIGICNTTENILFGIDAKGKVLNANKTFENLKYDENKNLNIILDYYDIDNCKLFIYYGNIPHFDYKCIIGSKKIQMVYDNIPSGAYKLCIAFSNNYGVAELQHCQIYGSASAQFDEFSITKENDIKMKENKKKKMKTKNKKTNEKLSSEVITDKAGLVFGVGRVHSLMKRHFNKYEIESAIYLAGAIEFATAELLLIACDEAKDNGHERIRGTDIRKAVIDDIEFIAVLGGVEIIFDEENVEPFCINGVKNDNNNNKWEHIGFDELMYVKPLSNGTFGRVHLCMYNQQKVAVKHPRYLKQVGADMDHHTLFAREIAFTKLLSSPGMVGLIGIINYDNKLFMVSQLYDMDLFNVFCFWNRVTNQDKELLPKKLVVDLSPALNEMHNKRVVHKDIKLENILVKVGDVNHTFAFTDLGTCAFINGPDPMALRFPGSVPYIPVQDILNQNTIKRAVDMFSFGLVLFQTIFGHMSLNTIHKFNCNSSSLKDVKSFQNAIWKYLNNAQFPENSPINIVKTLLTPNEADRITSDQLCNHKLIGNWSKLDYKTFLVNLSSSNHGKASKNDISKYNFS